MATQSLEKFLARVWTPDKRKFTPKRQNPYTRPGESRPIQGGESGQGEMPGKHHYSQNEMMEARKLTNFRR